MEEVKSRPEIFHYLKDNEYVSPKGVHVVEMDRFKLKDKKTGECYTVIKGGYGYLVAKRC